MGERVDVRLARGDVELAVIRMMFPICVRQDPIGKLAKAVDLVQGVESADESTAQIDVRDRELARLDLEFTPERTAALVVEIDVADVHAFGLKESHCAT
jgi:hypothetical protein